MARKGVSAVLLVAVALAGCSSRPRNFDPRLSAAPTDAQLYEAQLRTCREQAANSVKKGSGRLGSAAAGTAAGVGAGTAVAAGTSGATYATMAGAAAAGAAAIMVVPVFAVAGAWGVAKIRKNKKERTIKTVMADCLQKSGYSVAGWRVMSKKEVRALANAPAPPPPATAPQA